MTGEKYITVPVLSSGFAILWGIFALSPSIDLFTTHVAIYGRMQALAPETFWGTLMITAGVTALGLYFTHHAKLEAALLAVIFTLFSVLYFLGDIRSPEWALYGFIAICNYLMLWARIWRN